MKSKFYTRNMMILVSLLLLMLSAHAAQSTETFISQAGNLTYQGIDDNQQIHLKKGVWQGKPFQSNSASRPRVGLIRDFSFSGDLNHDGQVEHIVFLWESSGGSGTQIYMAVIAGHNGQWTNIATQHIGDRIQLQMGRVQQANIELDVIQAGRNDPACCPTQHVLRRWKLAAGQLVEQPPLELGPLSLKDIQGINWQLIKLNWQEKVPANSNISIHFKQHKASGNSGCNRYTTTVTEGKTPGDISFAPVAGTRMFCEPEQMELEMRFLKALENVKSFGFVNGYLTLEWQDDGAVSTLFFRPVK